MNKNKVKFIIVFLLFIIVLAIFYLINNRKEKITINNDYLEQNIDNSTNVDYNKYGYYLEGFDEEYYNNLKSKDNKIYLIRKPASGFVEIKTENGINSLEDIYFYKDEIFSNLFIDNQYILEVDINDFSIIDDSYKTNGSFIIVEFKYSIYGVNSFLLTVNNEYNIIEYR